MSNDNSENTNSRYTLRPTFTPLPSKRQQKATEAEADVKGRPDIPHGAVKQPAPSILRGVDKQPAPSILRGANEDDDLYDPYSDVHDGTLREMEFEKDPWN